MAHNVKAFVSGGHRCKLLLTASCPPACTNAVLAAVFNHFLMEKGTYIAKVRCLNIVEAMCNGMSSVFPEVKMVYDGKWCNFYKGGKKVFDCNPSFAKANFDLKAVINGG